MRKNDNNIIIVFFSINMIYFEILKHSEYPLGEYVLFIHQNLIFYQSVPLMRKRSKMHKKMRKRSLIEMLHITWMYYNN